MMQGTNAEVSDLSDALLKLLQTSKEGQFRGSPPEQPSLSSRSRIGSWPSVPAQLASPGPQDLRASQNAVPWQPSATQSLSSDGLSWNGYEDSARSTGSAHSLDRSTLTSSTPGDALPHLQGKLPNGACGQAGLLGPLAGVGPQLSANAWPTGQPESLGQLASPGARLQAEALFAQTSAPLPYIQPELQPEAWTGLSDPQLDQSQILRLLQLAGQSTTASSTPLQLDLAALLQHSAPNPAHPLAAAASSALYQGLPLEGLRAGWPHSAALMPVAQAPQRLGPASHSLPSPPLTEDALAIMRQQQALSLSQGLLQNGHHVNGAGLPFGGPDGAAYLRTGWPKGYNQQAPLGAGRGKAARNIQGPYRKPYVGAGAVGGITGPAADQALLNAELMKLIEGLRPTELELSARAQAFEFVHDLLTARWSDARVHVFGSTANQLSIVNNNDIDMCLELPGLPDLPGAKAAVVEEIGRLFTQARLKDVLPLPKARVPVVKLVAPSIGTKVDLTVNNLLALVNTKLLRDYAAIDERLVQLVFVVKHWAKRRQVNDAYRGTLSSYCYVLMCIAHLQHRQPPILPCLQALPPTHFRTIGRWNCDYHDAVEGLKGFGSGNKETLAELVWSFFEFWAWRHDFNNSVVSIRTLAPISKAEKEWTKRVGNERHLVSIEDPFELTHDLGRTMDRQTTSVLHKEFERAATLLRDEREPLSKLLEPYRAVSKLLGEGL